MRIRARTVRLIVVLLLASVGVACQQADPVRDLQTDRSGLDSAAQDSGPRDLAVADFAEMSVDMLLDAGLCADLGTATSASSPLPPPRCEVEADCNEAGFNIECFDGRCCGDSGCLDCLNDSHCPSQACVSGKCVSCTEDCHCARPRPVCETLSGTCYECQSDADCPATTPRCIGTLDVRWSCVECIEDTDCPDATPLCLPDTWLCNECILDEDCPGGLGCSVVGGRHRCAVP